MTGLPEQRRAPARIVEIPHSDAGQRIDNFLLARLKGVPRSRIYRILRRGEVRVNRRRVRPEYRIQGGDRIRIPPLRTSETAAATGRVRPDLLAELAARIIYEDEALLVLDKPSGMAVHGGSGVRQGVIESLRALRPTAPYLELVHRLDRDTSGCLMIAKKRSALRRLHQLLRTGQVSKRYLALVRGRWQGRRQKVSCALRKNVRQSGERQVLVSEEGKPAVTLFAPIRRFAHATLMDVSLQTGRTHQIRVHAAHVGHPLAGDAKYGDRAFNRLMRGYGLRRLFLHAQGLEFILPDTNKHIDVTIPLPPELDAVLARLPAR